MDGPPDERRSRTAPIVRRSIVIPMYRERDRVPATLRCLAASTLDDAGTEIILVDDGSDDDTASVAEAEVTRLGLRARVLRRPHLGKGAAVASGMLAAKGAAVTFTDADLSTGVGDIDACLRAVEAGGVDVVVGTRTHDQSHVATRGSRIRKLSGWSYNWTLQLLGLTRMRDTQCGLKGFRCGVVPALFGDLRTVGFAFDIEVLARADHLGLRVAELPVNWSHVPASRVRVGRDAPRMLLDALRVRRLVSALPASTLVEPTTSPSEAVAGVRDRDEPQPGPQVSEFTRS